MKEGPVRIFWRRLRPTYPGFLDWWVWLLKLLAFYCCRLRTGLSVWYLLCCLFSYLHAYLFAYQFAKMFFCLFAA